MCSRPERTAWRADGASGDRFGGIAEAITARSQCAILTMECYRESEVIPHNEVLAFGCCSCSSLESYTWDLGHCFAVRGPSGRGLPDHPRLMPTDFTTLPHFSVSSEMSLPKSTGEPGRAVAPSSASRVLILGSARPALTSLLSVSMISSGVPLAAPKPVIPLAS